MNGRERLLSTFRRERPDRIPIAPFLYINAVYERYGYEPDIDWFWDPPDFDVVEKYVDYCREYRLDVLHLMGSVFDAYNGTNLPGDLSVFRPWDNWDVTVEEQRKGDEKRRVLTIHTPGGDLREVDDFRHISKYTVVLAITEYLIKDKDDFEIFRRYAPPADVMDCRMITRARAATGDAGLSVCCIQGAFNTLNAFRRLEQMLTDPLLDAGFFREMIEYYSGWVLQRLQKILATGAADVIEIGANLATSGVGPGFYRKYLLDYERKLIDTVHQAGAYTILHNCGDAARIMHLYNEMGIDCWGYLTPPPFGDVDLDEVLRTIRPDMVLRGNIDQVEFLKTATPVAIRNRVRDLLLKVKERGNFILSTTDWWFDDLPEANLRAFIEAGLEYGKY